MFLPEELAHETNFIKKNLFIFAIFTIVDLTYYISVLFSTTPTSTLILILNLLSYLLLFFVVGRNVINYFKNREDANWRVIICLWKKKHVTHWSVDDRSEFCERCGKDVSEEQ